MHRKMPSAIANRSKPYRIHSMPRVRMEAPQRISAFSCQPADNVHLRPAGCNEFGAFLGADRRFHRRGSGSVFASSWMCPSGYDTCRDDLPFRAIAQLFPRPNTVITMKPTLALALLGTLAFGGTASAQKTFEWQPANDESGRLDPANDHTGRTYRPGPGGGNLHVDIVAQQPVTIFMTGEADWKQALQYPEAMGSLRMLCLREHVVKTTYLCDLPGEPMTLVVRDDRGSTQSAAYAGLGEVLKRDGAVLNTPAGNAVGVGIGLAAVLKAQAAPSRHFKSPNDVHIQYYRLACISNCFPPEFQWIQQARV